MRTLGWVALLLVATAAAAHEGHPHEEEDDAVEVLPPAPTADVGNGPHLALHDARVEVVATAAVGEWVITVDDYASNAPLSGLTVQVQQGSRRVQATAAADATYRVPADLLAGGAAAAFDVRGEGWTTRLEGALPPAPVPAAASVPAAENHAATHDDDAADGTRAHPYLIAGAALFMLAAFAGFGFGLHRRHRRRRPPA